MVSELGLKRRINACLRAQGYCVARGVVSLKTNDKKSYRQVQEHARFLKLQQHLDFLHKHKLLALKHSIDGCVIYHAEKIQPRLIEVKSGSVWDTLFKWWCLVWWSAVAVYLRAGGDENRKKQNKHWSKPYQKIA